MNSTKVKESLVCGYLENCIKKNLDKLDEIDLDLLLDIIEENMKYDLCSKVV